MKLKVLIGKDKMVVEISHPEKNEDELFERIRKIYKDIKLKKIKK